MAKLSFSKSLDEVEQRANRKSCTHSDLVPIPFDNGEYFYKCEDCGLVFDENLEVVNALVFDEIPF